MKSFLCGFRAILFFPLFLSAPNFAMQNGQESENEGAAAVNGMNGDDEISEDEEIKAPSSSAPLICLATYGIIVTIAAAGASFGWAIEHRLGSPDNNTCFNGTEFVTPEQIRDFCETFFNLSVGQLGT